MFVLRNSLRSPDGDVGGAGSSGSGEGIEGAGVGGEAAPEWMETLPEDLQGSGALRKYESLESAANAFLEAQRLQGSSVRIPNGESSAEVWSEFDAKLSEKVPGLVRVDPDNPGALYARMGRPEEASGYTAPSFDEGVTYNTERIDSFRPIAHKHGLSDKQFAGVVADMVALENGAMQQARSHNEQQMAALKESEGERFDETMVLAQRFLDTVGKEHKFDAPLNALTTREISMYADVMRRFGSEGAGGAGDDGSEPGGKMTPAQAREEIDAVQGNRDHPYHDRSHPSHGAARRRMRELYVLEQGGANETVATLGGVGGGARIG